MKLSFVPFRSAAASIAVATLLAACAVGPDYVRPTLDVPAAFKEAPPTGDWKSAAPQLAGSHEPWWQVFGDPVLDGLMTDAERANQNLRVAEAQYRQAEALASVARSALYPTIGANFGAQRARGGANINNANSTGRIIGVETTNLSASWAPDLWGSVRRTIEANDANVQASADDLAGVHLSIQTALAQDYLQLRNTDEQRDLYAATIGAYTRALNVTRAQYDAGVALRSDLALAESQLGSAQAAAVDLEASRAQFEHAIAVLTGRAPARFSLPRALPGQSLALSLPTIPAGLPSELLERRPDIAAAERRVAQANANIGVAEAAYFPNLLLSVTGGFSAVAIGNLFDTPNRVWSLGATLAETLFDGGLRRARDRQAVALWDASVGTYKQTVLNGFQQVEDNLSNLNVLDREVTFQAQAVKAGQIAERLALTQYRAGTGTYLAVVTAQTLSLVNQRTAVQLHGRQFFASVALVTAIGGGWQVGDAVMAGTPGNPRTGTAAGGDARAATHDNASAGAGSNAPAAIGNSASARAGHSAAAAVSAGAGASRNAPAAISSAASSDAITESASTPAGSTRPTPKLAPSPS